MYIYSKNSVKNQIIQYNIKNKQVKLYYSDVQKLYTKINKSIECNFKEIEGMHLLKLNRDEL
jgi:hypothetical protein